MGQGMNRVTLVGNLGAEPELKYFDGGTKVLKLRLATNDTWRDKEGVQQERTEWHSITVFGSRGESLSRFLKKGDRLVVEGQLRTSSYEKDGVRKYRTEVIARDVLLAGASRRGGEASLAGQGVADVARSQGPSKPNGAPPPLPNVQDDIPF